MTTQELDKMTPEEKRIAIAQICGLNTEPIPLWAFEGLGVMGNNQLCEEDCWNLIRKSALRNQCDPLGKVWKSGNFKAPEVPDYLNSLDAMHEAEKVLEDDQLCGPFSSHLQDLVGHHRILTCIHRASAAQRADAFLLTMLP